MKDYRKLKQIVKNHLDVRASDKTHDRIRNLILDVHGPVNKTESVLSLINIRSNIMRGPILKVTLVAVVVAALVIGFSQLGDSSSGVAWGEVVRQVEANRGIIYRSRKTDSLKPAEDSPKAYVMHARSPIHSRTDWYKDNAADRTIHFDLRSKISIWLAHDHKVYAETPISDADITSVQNEFMRPEDLVNKVVSHDYRKLPSKDIDGVPCEGIETTDLNVLGANHPVKSFVGRLWVSIETNYPVLAEGEITSGEDGSRKQTFVLDQFQWNVDFTEGERQIDIPSDFRLME